jgi:sugar-specific transcriptional regulator TrmB
VQYFESLKQLGFNQREQDVYITLLEMQKAKINELAQRANTKRSTTYDILYRLKKEGFVSEVHQGKKHYFIANDPEMILSLLEEKKRLYKRELPAILTLYNTLPQKPKVAYFEGLEGIKELYEDTLLTLGKGDTIFAYVTDDSVKYLDEYIQDYVKRRAAKGIRSRGILQETPGITKYLEHNREQLRNSKTVKESEFPLENEINIYANKVIIATYEPEPFGILIESKAVANTQRAIFEMAWRGI